MKPVCYLTLAGSVALLLSACSDASPDAEEQIPPVIGGDIIRFHHLGLDSVAVESLYHADDRVWAAGNGALYVSRNPAARSASEANWERLLDGYHFTQVTGFDSNTLFALGLDHDLNHTELFSSTDGGASWSLLKHNFGTDAANNSETAPVERLLPDPATGNLYGVGADLLAVSYDQGATWHTLSGQAGLIARNFALSLHPLYNDLWWGGQNAIEQLAVHRFSLNNNAARSWHNLFPAPSTVESIVFDRYQPDRVLIGAEGGIARSQDYGDTWQQVHSPASYIFYMALLQSERYPDVWYSARWEKSNHQHQLTFTYSTDRGASWHSSTHPPRNGNDGVRDMVLLSQQEGGQDILWLGLQSGTWASGGVMRVAVDLQVFN